MSTSKDKLPLKSLSCDISNSQLGAEKQTKLSGYEQDEIEANKLQKSDEQNTKCLDTLTSSQGAEASAWQPSNWGEYRQLSLWKSTPMLNSSSDTTSQESPSTQTSLATTQSQENLTSSQWDSPVQALRTQEAEQDSNTQHHLFGEKVSDVLLKLNPASALWNNLKELSLCSKSEIGSQKSEVFLTIAFVKTFYF